MKKQLTIFHGTGSNSKSYWHPYIRVNLEKEDYDVIIPNLPNTDTPKLDETLEFVDKNVSIQDDSIFIWHSSWCPLILSLLEKLNVNVKRVILVAWFCDTLNSKMLQSKYNWDVIKSKCQEFIFINATNYPWWCNDLQGRKMFEKLWWTLIINNEGHMVSWTYNQDYKEFPLLLKLIK